MGPYTFFIEEGGSPTRRWGSKPPGAVKLYKGTFYLYANRGHFYFALTSDGPAIDKEGRDGILQSSAGLARLAVGGYK